MNYNIALALLIFVSFLAATGHILVKQTAKKELSLSKKLTQPRFVLGIILFLICPALSALAAEYVDFTVLYGMTSLNFVFIFIFTAIFLKEIIDKYKILSSLFIILGLFFLLI